ncbi:laccase-14-like isoform X2 [Carya illinoinensis]|uniref:Laccase n=1 Tax=Carya illinoinensis TaxID=32201 RepID=A0A922D2U7_CARIL|nr:laccase-14-like isoform X2 [Carya illinoinensis]KAG6676602.1 hypothetical protein I3842_15G160000 [Carya illinoinensis]
MIMILMMITPSVKLYVLVKFESREWFSGNMTEFFDTEEKRHTRTSLSDAYTINGLFNCTADEGYRLVVESGRTYLLRIVGASMDHEMFFAVADHNLTVVGQDGSYVKPITTTYIMITPGQTFDILLTADQLPSCYYMAVGPYNDGGNHAQRNSSIATAILQYKSTSCPPIIPFPNQLPKVADTVSAKNFTDQIKSRDSVNLPEKPDDKIFIAVAVSHQLICGKVHASLNNISFVHPKIDILQAYHRSLPNIYETDFPHQPASTTLNFTGDDSLKFEFPILGTKILMIEYNRSVEIVFQGTNLGAENHPMHLHGYSFYVVATGDGNFNETEYKNNLNLIDPPYLNTVGVPRNGWVAIRFVANNPGVWFMHCHLERHAMWGMDTAFIVTNGITENQSIREPPNGLPECSSSYNTTTSNFDADENTELEDATPLEKWSGIISSWNVICFTLLITVFSFIYVFIR